MKKQHIASTVFTIAALSLAACGKKNSKEAAAVGDAPSAPATSGVPLTTVLPPELIEGTPQPMDVPTLVQALTKAPELLVP